MFVITWGHGSGLVPGRATLDLAQGHQAPDVIMIRGLTWIMGGFVLMAILTDRIAIGQYLRCQGGTRDRAVLTGK